MITSPSAFIQAGVPVCFVAAQLLDGTENATTTLSAKAPAKNLFITLLSIHGVPRSFVHDTGTAAVRAN
ncbi:hypothetical protein XACLC80_790009 [Xanthomonas citri pv. citri]|nr:hypothetical protein XACLC80_790009 [Xanthomonas citri pv. citri]